MTSEVYCFLDTSVIFSMSVGGKIVIKNEEIVIEHKFYHHVLDLEKEIKERPNLAITSSSVLNEVNHKKHKVIVKTVEDFRYHNENWKIVSERFTEIARVIDEIEIQSLKKLFEILSYIKTPPFDQNKVKKLKPTVKQFLEKNFINYIEHRIRKGKTIPKKPSVLVFTTDSKIISECLVIKEGMEKTRKVKIHFVTTDGYLASICLYTKFNEKFGINTDWPTDVIKLI